MDETRMKAMVNPLEFEEAMLYVTGFPQKVTPEDAIGFLCGYGVPHDMAALLRRYKEIHDAQTERLNIAPADPQFMARIIQPLAQAKGSYMIGNFLGTIALCGMVCEMLSVLLFEMMPLHLKGQPMSKGDEERLFGDSLEHLRQERRVKILFALGIISEDIKSDFDCVRKLRNKYLHVYSHEPEDAAGDARQTHAKTLSLVVRNLGYSISGGAFRFRPEFMKYLASRGLVRVAEGPATDGAAPATACDL
jgi:hypothetical protein